MKRFIGNPARYFALLATSLLASGCMNATNTLTTSATVGASESSGVSAPTGYVTLTWGANAGEQTGFYIEQSSDGINFTQVQSVPNGTNQAMISGLYTGKTYYFRIRGYNPAGNSPYSPILTANVP
jgi:titin